MIRVSSMEGVVKLEGKKGVEGAWVSGGWVAAAAGVGVSFWQVT